MDGRSLEVCREFTRDKCTRSAEECRYAHPPPHVETRDGRVICCVDSLKGRCTRDTPPCRFMHPPEHLKARLLEIGRSVRTQYGAQGDDRYGSSASYRGAGGARGGGYAPSYGGGRGGPQEDPFSSLAGGDFTGLNPYLASTLRGYKAVLDAALTATGGGAGAWGGYGGGYGAPGNGYGGGRGGFDRPPSHGGLEVCREFLRGRCTREASTCRFAHPEKSVSVSADNTVTPCMDFINNKCTRGDACRYFHAPEHLKAIVRSRGRPAGYGGEDGGASRKRSYSDHANGGGSSQAEDSEWQPLPKRSGNDD